MKLKIIYKWKTKKIKNKRTGKISKVKAFVFKRNYFICTTVSQKVEFKDG